VSLFPEWQEAHKDDPSLPERIRVMRAMYGKRDDKKCRTCKFLEHYKQSASWMKCKFSKHTGGTATDWKARWPACGKFEEDKDE